MNHKVAVQLIKKWEGLAKLKRDGYVYPYLCPAGVPTQGYGHVVSSLTVQPITKSQALDILMADIEIYGMAALKHCPKLSQWPNAWAAITSFCFNLGVGAFKASTLRKRLNEGKLDEAAREILKWKWAAGKVLPGLVARRAEESLLILNDH